MKIKKSSWHYRFIDACGFYPKSCKTRFSYVGTFIASFWWCFLAFGWIVVVAHKIKFNMEPVEFVDDDET